MMMHEQVALPDPKFQPLVHPVDLPEARGAFRRAWLLSLVGSAEVLVLVGSLLWWATRGWTAPVLAILSTGIIAEWGRRHHVADAWGHIPRRRQDLARPLPLGWSVVRAFVLPLCLVAGLVVVLAGLDGQGSDPGVRAYTLGASLGLGVALVGATCLAWWSRRTMADLLSACCALGSVLLGAVVASVAGWVPPSPDSVTVLLGAVALIGIYAAWWLSTRTS